MYAIDIRGTRLFCRTIVFRSNVCQFGVTKFLPSSCHACRCLCNGDSVDPVSQRDPWYRIYLDIPSLAIRGTIGNVAVLIMAGGRAGVSGGREGWRDGGMEGWMDGGMEGWRDGGMEGWRDGGMDGWRDGGMDK